MANGTVRVKINPAGARAVLKDPGVQAELLNRARAIAGHANSIGKGKHISDVQAGKNRAVAMVRCGDSEAHRDNAKNNTLLKSIDAGRG